VPICLSHPVYVKHGNTNERAIIAFRGACLDPSVEQCRNDMCFANGQHIPFALPFEICQVSGTTYIQQAINGIRAVRQLLGTGYGLLISGHSLGGGLVMLLDSHPEAASLDFQVVALEAMPWGNFYRAFGFDDEKLQTLNHSKRWAVYDPHDLEAVSYQPMSQLRPATTVCVYEGIELPKACQDCMDKNQHEDPSLNSTQARKMCYAGPSDPQLHYSKCRDAVHFLDHYAGELIRLKDAQGGPRLPNCSIVGV